MSHRSVVVVLLLLFSTVGSGAGLDREAQRQRFLAAEAALSSGRIDEFKRLETSLGDYPLAPYLRFAWLSGRLRHTPDSELTDFIDAYPDSPLSGRLRSQWLVVLAKRQRWKQFLRAYSGQPSTKLRCLKATAGLKTAPGGRLTPSLRDDIEALWLSPESRPDACDYPFATLRRQGYLSDELVWGRIALAMPRGKASLAGYLKRFLQDPVLKTWVDRWLALRKQPQQTLQQARWDDSVQARALVRDGLRRVARRDAAQAHRLWQSLRADFAFDSAQSDEMDAYIARRAALQRLPEARQWLAQVPRPDAGLRAWRLRAALAERDWDGVLAAYAALDAEQRDDDHWRYWQARALEARADPGADSGAVPIYRELAAGRGFHSFLAADRVGLPYNFGHQPLAVDQAALRRVRQLAPIQRAQELFRLGRYWQARGEWAKGLRGLDRTALLAAARLAADWGWDGRVIATLARARAWNEVELRFPLRYGRQVSGAARSNGIDPSWLFGVVRQESAFVPDARSSAGARGLMQLMPATGRETARLLREPLRKLSDLNQPRRNIQLGSAYLKRVLTINRGSMVSATASYNAGPTRVRGWLPSQPQQADLWIEAIPFDETRRYVKNVLAYASIYDWRRGVDVTRVSDRMGTVQPR